MANLNIDPTIVAKIAEIKSLPYAKFVNNEDGIQRNFGYRIIRHLVASGRNSMIYKCEAPKLSDLYCVVKAYKFGKDQVKQALREETCQIMRYTSDKCAQLITTYDIFYTNEKVYIVCDWSSKGDVLNAIKTRKIRLNESMLRNWASDILSALNFLHSNAICHRNVAPSCLLLTQENRVKLTCLSDATIYVNTDGTLMKQKWAKFSRVTNWNQPPEVAKNKLYDPRRADIWSTGATVFWLIKRSHPIDYKSNSKMTTQLNDKIRMIQHKVSSKCVSWVKKMLSFQPYDRPTVIQAQEMPWISGAEELSTSTSKHEKQEPTLMPEKGENITTGEATGVEMTDTTEPSVVNEAAATEPEPSKGTESPAP